MDHEHNKYMGRICIKHMWEKNYYKSLVLNRNKQTNKHMNKIETHETSKFNKIQTRRRK